MRRKLLLPIFFLLLIATRVNAAPNQSEGKINGTVKDEKTMAPIEAATVALVGTKYGTHSDENGRFELSDIPAGSYQLQVQFPGYTVGEKNIVVEPNKTVEVTLLMKGEAIMSEKVVVTATRTEKFRRDVPVVVNVVDNKMIEATQSLNVAEGLNFQPAVRVENNCQNCGFNQVRMNGLEGPYSQILINSRPVFSSLAGVYGLEHIPSIMIDRVEVTRGGGSALYGGNAIAGTINIITKEPEENHIEVSTNTAFIEGEIPDNMVNLAGSLITDERNAGVFLFGTYRDRHQYDANGDGFSELSKMDNNALGLRGFYRPAALSKIEAEFHRAYEDRRGGNKFDLPRHEADVTEGAIHTAYSGSLSYEQFLDDRYFKKLTLYTSLRHTDRDSYYGPPDVDGVLVKSTADAYGFSEDLVFMGGVQYTHVLENRLGKKSEFTVGAENLYNRLEDSQPAYDRFIDQIVREYGFFVQDDWKINETYSVLLGMRLDKHNLIDDPIFNPRASLMINLTPEFQFRSSFARGYRAPQTFDEDLHVTGAGGENQIIRNASDLSPERSTSLSGSLDYTVRKIGSEWGITVEGFYTRLTDAFGVVSIDTDPDDDVLNLERRNEGSATVFGGTVDARYLTQQFQVQGGFTVQSSKYDDAVEWSSEKPELATDEFLRTPAFYGYFSAIWPFMPQFELSASGIYTGSMKLSHVAGYVAEDELVDTDPFFELNLKLSYEIPLGLNSHSSFNLSVGVQNIFNSYQDDFDKYADRDAGYVYGPTRPRTFFVGTKIML